MQYDKRMVIYQGTRGSWPAHAVKLQSHFQVGLDMCGGQTNSAGRGSRKMTFFEPKGFKNRFTRRQIN